MLEKTRKAEKTHFKSKVFSHDDSDATSSPTFLVRGFASCVYYGVCNGGPVNAQVGFITVTVPAILPAPETKPGTDARAGSPRFVQSDARE
jgi:hypothetical protein